MKTKLFGIALILLGLASLGWTAVIVLMVKGMAILIYGVDAVGNNTGIIMILIVILMAIAAFSK